MSNQIEISIRAEHEVRIYLKLRTDGGNPLGEEVLWRGQISEFSMSETGEVTLVLRPHVFADISAPNSARAFTKALRITSRVEAQKISQSLLRRMRTLWGNASK